LQAPFAATTVAAGFSRQSTNTAQRRLEAVTDMVAGQTIVRHRAHLALSQPKLALAADAILHADQEPKV
jgi:hypothetical protein